MTVQTLDVGKDEAMTIDTNAPDARSMMLASASAIAAFVIESEGKLADTAKAWGHALFRAVYVDGANMDSMIGDSKVAAGWSVLTTNDVGKKAKARLEVYFSNARKVAEAWGGMEQAARDDVLAGLSSIHYLAGQLRKAEADAKKAADKAAKLAKAEEEAANAKAEADANGPIVTDDVQRVECNSLADIMALALDMLANADDAEVLAASDAVAMLTAAYDARVNAALAAEPVAIAA